MEINKTEELTTILYDGSVQRELLTEKEENEEENIYQIVLQVKDKNQKEDMMPDVQVSPTHLKTRLKYLGSHIPFIWISS
jgi:hypothetical protein